MKEARYPIRGLVGDFGNNVKQVVTYDETAPCRCCQEPVGEASMGGTDFCPACDCGYRRSEHCPPGSRPLPE